MDGYHIALFLHIASLMASGGSTSITHFARLRRARSTTISAAREWHGLLLVSARTFPFVLLVLLLSGGFMMSQHGGWSWRDGWVETGVLGILLLGMIGGVLGKRGRAMADVLAAHEASAGADAPPPPLRDALAEKLAWMNLGIALGEAFVMTTKPALLPALAAVAVGALATIMVGRRLGGGSHELHSESTRPVITQPV